jgi:glycosyltransferase involved in cell wall biosynthesis
MPDTPRVSIGLPVYNGERYLALAIESILAQTFGDFELIVGDNASSDGTEEICRRFAARDPRIRYLRHPQNIGGSANFNEVYYRSRQTPYFRWAAHDDLLAPRNLEACVTALDAAPRAVIAYPRTVIIDADGTRVREHDDRMDIREPRAHERLVRVVQAWSMCNPAFALMRRSALEHTGLIRAHPSADVVMLCELALLGEFHEVPEPLFFRRVHEQMSWRANKTASAMALWYDPRARSSNLLHNRTRLFFRVVGAVWQFEMPRSERMRCLAAMIPAWWWRRMRVRGGALRDRLLGLHAERG